MQENVITYKEHFTNLTEHELKYAPEKLYYEGDLKLLDEGIKISVVGSRKASPEGIKRTQLICHELVNNGMIVVSGLAEGIDTVAHNTAIINGGKTIAVLGTPLSRAYPPTNTSLLNEIKKNHLAISQFPESSKTYPSSFPLRNRTMALLSDATIIVEASEKSGTVHQGWEAIRLGRMLFILQNVVENPSVNWAKEMLKYGAQILNREELSETLESVVKLSPSTELSMSLL